MPLQYWDGARGMTTTKSLARYETALETLSLLIASYTAEIHKQGQTLPVGSQVLIALQAEKKRLRGIKSTLSLDDSVGIEQAISTYAPQVRAMYAKADAKAV
jgi:hypothetical protein